MPTLGDMFYRAVDAAFAVDGRQRIIYWDPGCEELFGRPAQSVLGRSCAEVMKGRDPGTGAPLCCAGCSVAQLAEGGCAPAPYKIQVNPPGGDPMNFQVNIALVPSDCKRRWTVLHLLHRDNAPGVLTALNYSVRHAPTVTSTGIPGIVDGTEPTSRLTTREQQVLELLAEGLSSNTMSKRLGISLTTVRNHIQHIQSKLGVHSQSEAVAYAYRHNLV